MYPSQTALIIRCCVQERGDDDWEDDDEADSAREGAAVQLVEPVPWHGRPDGGPLGAPPCPQAAVPRSLSGATTVIPTGRE